MRTEWLKTRQTKYATYATVYTLVIVAVLVIANYLANRYNKAYDATANKRYSLSDQSIKIVKGLKQDVRFTYWDNTTRFQQAKDLLDRYSTESPKVHVEYIDPYKKPQLARQAGIKNLGTVQVELGTKREEAKSVTEEGITGALVRALKGGERTVCTVSGSGEHSIDDTERDGFSGLKEALERDNYKSRSLSLLQKAEVPADCTVLLVGGPRSDYLQPAVNAIKTYVETGGRALFLLDPPLKMGRQDIAENAALSDVLAGWGVTLHKDLIIDLNPVGQLFGLGPEIPLVTTYESHPIVREMRGTTTGFPISRSIEIKNMDKATVEKLFSSSDSSLSTTNLSSPSVNPNDPNNKKGPLVMAAAGTYNTGQPNKQGRFVVVGSSGWAVNGFLRFNGNRDLLLNTMNWLSSDEDLISIRPKEQEDRRITLTRAQMAVVRIVSQFLLPLVVVIAGVFVWWRRR